MNLNLIIILIALLDIILFLIFSMEKSKAPRSTSELNGENKFNRRLKQNKTNYES
jgi:hypothetical protein